jgi:xylulokinase
MNESQSYVLGVDLGTGSVKCVVLDAAGHPCGRGTSPYATSYPAPGFAEQDAEQWYAAAASATRAAVDDSGVPAESIRCIGLCGAAHIPVLLGEHDQLLRPAILWSDQRSAKEVEYLVDHFGELLLRECSNQASCTWTLPQLLWLKQHEPETIGNCRQLLVSKDYLIFRLTGERVTDIGSAASTLMMNLHTNTWCPELVQLSGLRDEVMPTIFSPTERVGQLHGQAAADLGLVPGTSVVAGSLDTAAELLGLGVIRPGQAVLRLGTAGALNVVTTEPDPSPMTLTYPQAYGPWWLCQAGTNSCGNAIQWVSNVVGPSSADGRSFSPSELDSMASQAPPGCEGLLFHPYLLGERAPYWDPKLKASFTGVAMHHGKEHFVRAVQEGVAFSLRDCCQLMDKLGFKVQEVKLGGGGAQGEQWSRVISNVVGLPLQKTKGDDSAVGAAILAGLAMQFFASVEEAVQSTVVTDYVVQPDPELTARYTRLFEEYQQIHNVLAPIYQAR